MKLQYRKWLLISCDWVHLKILSIHPSIHPSVSYLSIQETVEYSNHKTLLKQVKPAYSYVTVDTMKALHLEMTMC